MNVIETKIEGLLILEPRVFGDDRGWFMESFNQKAFEQALSDRGLEIPQFVQDNHSFSQRGVLRGLHFQKAPYAQGKLVRVVQGRAWDVAVDIRENSKTFGEWVGVELTADNHKQFWIPEGFAHGFVVLSETAIFSYKCDNFYNKESEGCVKFNDSDLNIDWKISESDMILSEKDQKASSFKDHNF